ncbi:hypothetical protein C8R43DRAFT_818007, partial [Mycena crocata]
LVHEMCSAFSLTREQETALRFVARHVFSDSAPPLNVGFPRVGGRGYSRTIDAIVAFFAGRKNTYTFTLVGPTGSTAAMFYTYHSVISM